LSRPEGHTPPGGLQDDGFQSIPESKIEDFGVHANAYYQLDIEFFKSPLDKRLLELMWNKYWVNTLSSSPLLMNAGFVTGQLSDLTTKLETAERQLSVSGRGGRMFSSDGKKKEETKLAECVRTSSKTSIEVVSGLATQLIKEAIFNTAATTAP
jgi:COP9 signalosome complex subunit 5